MQIKTNPMTSIAAILFNKRELDNDYFEKNLWEYQEAARRIVEKLEKKVEKDERKRFFFTLNPSQFYKELEEEGLEISYKRFNLAARALITKSGIYYEKRSRHSYTIPLSPTIIMELRNKLGMM